MAHKYVVDLTDEEQGYLHDVIRKGKTTARRVARAHVLLHAATGATDEDIAQTLHLGLTGSIAQYRTASGAYHINNTFRFLLARA